jgi:two-component system NtrC family sensor kinase
VKKLILISTFILAILTTVPGQQVNIDSLKKEFAISRDDTMQLILSGNLANAYSETNPDSAFYYSGKMLAKAKQLSLKLDEATALNEMGYSLISMGNYPRSLQMLLSAINIANDPSSEVKVIGPSYPPSDDYTDRRISATLQRLAVLDRAYQFLGVLYVNSGNYERALSYFREATPLGEKVNNYNLLCTNNISQGRAYISNRQLDSGLLSLQKAYYYATSANYHKYLGSIFLNMGRVFSSLDQQDSAKLYYRRSIEESVDHGYTRGVVASSLLLAEMFKQSGNQDSCLYYIQMAMNSAHQLNAPELFLRTYKALAVYYRNSGNNDSTVKYQALIIKINDSLFNSKQVQQFQNIDFDAQQQQQEIDAAKKAYQNRLRTYSLLGGMLTVLVVAGMLLRSNRQKRKTNALLQQQKEEIETAMSNLKATQAQLIQSEKMASLGELATGIAHEIQNPLNFVNNFSELNQELIAELNNEIDLGNNNEVKIIAENIRENESKINLHGRRADAIVKGMLHHGQSGTGQLEQVNINAMADEYLRMTYHGLKLKDKSFNAVIQTDFDPQVGNINVIPQDISRVLLNLYNNAFYAVSSMSNGIPLNDYQPAVTVSTRKLDNEIEISVKDNGVGISDKVKDKIFQPFFTTKPTGQGTGLGLSLSYDVIKAHGGELLVDSNEGQGTEFIIKLPVT